MGPVNARPLQDVRLNHDEGNREERPGRFLTTRAPIGQHVKIFRQLTTPPGHVKERVYPKLVNQDGDVQRYGGLKAIKKIPDDERADRTTCEDVQASKLTPWVM